MKKLLGTLACTFITCFVIAQKINVTGKVTDKQTNEPLAGAIVTLNNKTTLTNEEGIFSFEKVNKQKSIIKVSSIGFEFFTKEFSEEELAKHIFIQLISKALNLDALEVTSIRAGNKTPFTKTNLSKAEIAKLNVGQDLPFMFNQTPSVVINADAGNGIGYTGISIRGSDATRINVTLNGIPFNDAESQGTFFVNIPDIISSANSVQIQRGTGTTTNGTGSFGAAINISTNDFNEKPYAETNNAFSSFNTFKNTIKAGTGLIDNHFTVDTRLSKISSDGYIDRANSNLQSFYISGAYINKKSSLRLNIFSGKEKTYQAWNGVPENLLTTNRTYNSSGTEKTGTPYDNETDNYHQTFYQLFFNHKINNHWSFNVATFLTRGIGYYENYKAEQKFKNYGLPDTTIGGAILTKTDLVRQLWLDNYFYGNIFSTEYKKNKSVVTIGGGWTNYEGNHYGKIPWAAVAIEKDYTYYNLDAFKNEFHLYSKLQQSISKAFSFFADVQYRYVKHQMDGFRNNPSLFVNRKFNFFNPKIGITYTTKGWNNYISYAFSGKEPNRKDFEAGITVQPKAEYLHNIELGTEKRTAQYYIAATTYCMLYKNQLVLTGKVNDVGAYTRVNVPNSYRLGIELQGGYVFNHWLNAGANFTLSQNKIKQFTEYIDNYDNGTQITVEHTNSNITLSPSVIAAGSINFIPSKNMEISLLSKYVGKQYLDNTQNNNRSLSSFYTQDVRCIYTLKNKIFNEWNFMLQVNNVFNKLYEPNGYTFSYIYGAALTTENYYFPMAGTNFMLGINIKL
ncbi:MAG: TonB-dependent receptor [Chitinophagaceae bacterium]|nr:TonB-dependent receptor [Chitinophagaceae bacterium]MCW5904200.1 TonB-dependent receptor [Chitinophagaceae bacterium]